MYVFIRVSVLLAALLSLVGCGASAPTTTAPPSPPTAPALTQLALAPSARSDASLVYQSATQTLSLFGGKTESGANAETWSYDLSNNQWTQLEEQNAPSAQQPSDRSSRIGQARLHFRRPDGCGEQCRPLAVVVLGES
jgi:hypothetical protein